MREKQIFRLAEDVINGKSLKEKEALALLNLSDQELYTLFYSANKIRFAFKGNKVKFCSIVNAKSGACSEDCSFCAQSARYKTHAQSHPFISEDKILNAAQKAKKAGAHEFSIVTSGKSIKNQSEVERIKKAIKKIKKLGMSTCTSLGTISEEDLLKLKKAGLDRYHHNIETSKNFFKKICTTHSFESRVKTVQMAKKLKIRVCCGGIFGMGESNKDIVEMAFILRELDVDSVPINFLNPISGTPLENYRKLTPLNCLEIISLFRFTLPAKDIFICGGREVNLKDMQSWMYYAGANGALLGDYLTTEGRPAQEDRKLISDLGLKI